ncbi:MAG: GGDEF domain-containing protein, partial [Spirochaetales bacterium]|nr:GGDEF domain-containing protein [Spirochaetales bacterium]
DKRVYTFWSQFIGAGIVGGAMIDSKLAAEEMVKAVVFYNKYKRFDDNYKNLKLIIDWEGIENNNIPHSKIPKTASIYNKPTSFFIIYFREIIITAIIIVSCLLLIAIFWLRSMASSKKRLKELAETDPLTGLFNRRAFMTYLHYEISRKKRYNSPVSIVIIDIDHFKRVNDLYGHDAGDEVLKTLSELLQQNCRRSDRICRWGGEEFLLLLPETTARNANILAEKLRRLLEKTKQSIPEYITSSFGIAELNDREDFSQWFERADAALYKSKSNGRNQVTVEQ